MPLTEAKRTSVSIGSKVGILPKVLVRDRVRSGLPESSINSQLGRSLRKIRDTWGVPKEEMASVGFRHRGRKSSKVSIGRHACG